MKKPLRDRMILRLYKKKFNTHCVYCGAIRECWDHVLPYNVAANPLCDPSYYCIDVWELVACCKNCNSIAGGLAFRCFSEKRSYILKRRAELKAEREASRLYFATHCINCNAEIKLNEEFCSPECRKDHDERDYERAVHNAEELARLRQAYGYGVDEPF